MCDVILPRAQKRHVLEENNELEAKVSALEDDLDEEIELEDDKYKLDEPIQKEEKERHRERKKDRSRSRDRKSVG